MGSAVTHSMEHARLVQHRLLPGAGRRSCGAWRKLPQGHAGRSSRCSTMCLDCYNSLNSFAGACVDVSFLQHCGSPALCLFDKMQPLPNQGVRAEGGLDKWKPGVTSKLFRTLGTTGLASTMTSKCRVLSASAPHVTWIESRHSSGQTTLHHVPLL
eukprot:1145329-Pelagomonas_calceolata.AAC.2